MDCNQSASIVEQIFASLDQYENEHQLRCKFISFLKTNEKFTSMNHTITNYLHVDTFSVKNKFLQS